MSFLVLENISKQFSGVKVLSDISFSIDAGECVGLIGENGAGKSTLIKIISGIYIPSAGNLEINKESVNSLTPEKAQELCIATVPQELKTIDTLPVFEYMFLGNEIRHRGLLDKKEMQKLAKAQLDEFQLQIDPNSLLGNLSLASKQMVEVARHLLCSMKLLILDEPTTMLSKTEIDRLFVIVKQLKTKGVAVIFVSHKLEEVKQLTDRIIILRDGQLVSQSQTKEISIAEMANKMIGRELRSLFPLKQEPQADDLLEVSNLSVANTYKNISFTLHKGEILGITGLVGSGRTELLETIIGLRKYDIGKVLFRGKPLKKNYHKIMLEGIALITEDRQSKGLILEENAGYNITLSNLKVYTEFLFINKRAILKKVKEFFTLFGVRSSNWSNPLKTFSGGNQQKICIAKALEMDPQLIILDEPTVGVDIKAKQDIYETLSTLVKKGVSCIIISSEMEEIIGICHKVHVLANGQLSPPLVGDAINENNITEYAFGLKGPASA